LENVTLPCNLHNLILGSNFKQSLEHVILPSTLQTLKMSGIEIGFL